jgi:hypothetical protein
VRFFIRSYGGPALWLIRSDLDLFGRAIVMYFAFIIEGPTEALRYLHD